jgi:exodeoxyribonuclease-1
VFTPRKELEEEGLERIPLKDINIGKCPVVAPMNTLDDEAALRLGIDKELCLKHSSIINSDPGLLQKIREVFNQDKSKYYTLEDDPDLQIYSGGFFRDDDKIRMKIIHQTPPEELKTLTLNFFDPRIPEMLRRFIGRNFPSTLDEQEMSAWKSACAGRILFPKARAALDHGGFLKVLENLKYSTDVTPAQKLVVKELEKYEEILKDQVLKYAPSS